MFVKEVNSSVTSYTFSLGQGTHEIVLNAYDEAGNYASATLTIKVGGSGGAPGFELSILVISLSLVTAIKRKRKKDK